MEVNKKKFIEKTCCHTNIDTCENKNTEGRPKSNFFLQIKTKQKAKQKNNY